MRKDMCVSGLSKVGLWVVITVIIIAIVGGVLSYLMILAGNLSITHTVSKTGNVMRTSPSEGVRESLKGKKVLRIGIGIDADTLDPAGQTTTTIANIVRFMVETLFTVDEKGRLVPLLAESYNVSKDGLVYTVKLRKGIRFQDGTSFNATAVKFTFDRILNPKVRVPARGYFKVIKSVEVVDEYTVRFVLKRPFAPFLAVLAMTTAGIVSPTSVQKLGNKIAQEPRGIGTGPYMFKEWIRGERIVLVKNPHYWRGEPYFDVVDIEVIPDAQTREAKLLTGELDLIIQPPAADIKKLEKDPNIKVLKTLSTRVIFIGINTQWGPLRNKKVRQALNYAVDKEAIVRDVLFGLGKIMTSVLPDYVLGYEKLGPYEYNPKKAKELLEEAGYPNGFKVTLMTPVGRYLFDKEIAEAVAQYLREVGIDVEVKAIADWPTFVSELLQPLNKTRLQLYLLGWAPTVPDPHFYLYLRFHSGMLPPKGFNTFFYKNAEVDELLDKGVTTIDPKKRSEIYKKLNEILWDDAPNIYLHIQYFIVAMNKHIENIKLLPYEMIDITFAKKVGE